MQCIEVWLGLGSHYFPYLGTAKKKRYTCIPETRLLTSSLLPFFKKTVLIAALSLHLHFFLEFGWLWSSLYNMNWNSLSQTLISLRIFTFLEKAFKGIEARLVCRGEQTMYWCDADGLPRVVFHKDLFTVIIAFHFQLIDWKHNWRVREGVSAKCN